MLSQSPGKECFILQYGFGNREAAPRFQHTVEFSQRGALVGNVGKNRASGDHVHRRIGDAVELCGRALEKGTLIPHAASDGNRLGMTKHGAGNVGEYRLERWADALD